jgi:hypothetical protein
MAHAGRPVGRIPAALSIGNVLDLGSFGLVAAGIVAVFFGTSFSLLVPSIGSTISVSAIRAAPPAATLPLAFGRDRTLLDPAPAVEIDEAVSSSSDLPTPPIDALALTVKHAASHDEEGLAPSATSDLPAAHTAAPDPAPNAVTATTFASTTPGLSIAELSELLQHGDALLRTGDVVSARLFYERGASAGDARAALRLGATFDPAVLSRLGLGKLQADAAEARSWYSRALDLGAIEGGQLNAPDTKQGR